MKKMMTLLGLTAFASLSACSEAPKHVIVDIPYSASIKHPVIDGNKRVEDGYQRQFDGMGQEWPSYLVSVGISDTKNGDFHKSSADYVEGIPAMTYSGHMQEIMKHKDVGVYAVAWWHKDYKDNIWISVHLDLRKDGKVVRTSKDVIVPRTVAKDGQITMPPTVISETIELNGHLYALRVNLTPGPQVISDSMRIQGTGSLRNSQMNGGAWGTAMPMEEDSGSLSDVMIGGGGHKTHDPNFYDPIDEGRGGIGPIVR